MDFLGLRNLTVIEDTVNIAKSEHIHYMMIFLMAGLKSIAYNWLTDGCKTSSHTLAQIAFKQYQSLLDC